jgi:hypothetical protein
LVHGRLPTTDPPAVEDPLTPLGHRPQAVLVPPRLWTEERLDDINQARDGFDAQDEHADRPAGQRRRFDADVVR